MNIFPEKEQFLKLPSIPHIIFIKVKVYGYTSRGAGLPFFLQELNISFRNIFEGARRSPREANGT